MQPALSFTIVAAAGVAALAVPRWRPPARLFAHVGDPRILIPLGLGALLGPVLHVLDGGALRALAPVALIAAGWAGATAGARGEWAALARAPSAQLLVAAGRWAAVAVATGALVWMGARRFAPLIGVWAPLAAAAGTFGLAAAGDRRDDAPAAERGLAAGTTVVALALITIFFHARQTVGGASVGWHYWLVITPTLGAVFGLAAVGAARLAGELPLPRGLADVGVLVLAAGVGAATTVSPFVVCGLAAGAAASAAPDAPLRSTLAEHASLWRAILALCAGLWLSVPSVWLVGVAATMVLLREALDWGLSRAMPAAGPSPLAPFDVIALGIGVNAGLMGAPGAAALLGTIALAVALSGLVPRRAAVEVGA